MSHVARAAPPTLGVVAIARNEERDMPGFLDHLLPWVDEIVIVDDGSTDRTRELAEACGAKVRLLSQRMSEEGGFAQQRNAGIDIARSDWLLHMDIDERVTPQLAAEIGGAIAAARGNAFKYRRLNFFLHRPMNAGGWQRWNKPQLARRGTHRFVGRVHEECMIEGGAGCIEQLASAMWHLNDEDYSERVQKNARYMQMSGDELLAGGRKIRWYHLLAQPLWRALRAYLLDGAFRLGTRGLLFSVYTFCSVFNWYAYAWDKQNRIERAELEAELARQWRPASAPHSSMGESGRQSTTIARIVSRAQQLARTGGRFVRRFGITRGLAAYARIALAKRSRDTAAVIALDIPQSPAPFRIRPADADAHAFWQVFIEGEYDLPVPFAPAVIIDAGAHVGCAAVYFAHRFPQARIVAIEPAAANAALLRSNVAAIPRISVVQGALWSGPGELSIANPHAQSWSFRVTQPSVGAPTVPTVTIPVLLEQLGAIDILKLDIEGAEGELFRGDTGWLAHTRMVVLELHEHYAPGCTELVRSVMQARSFEQVAGRGENVVFINQAWAGRA